MGLLTILVPALKKYWKGGKTLGVSGARSSKVISFDYFFTAKIPFFLGLGQMGGTKKEKKIGGGML